MPNTAPSGTNATVTIPQNYVLRKSNFGFSDATDGNGFLAVKVTTLPTAGTLYYDSNGALGGGRSVVMAGQTISAADIAAGKLTFVASAGRSGAGYASFSFQVQDNGGTAGGGIDLDQSPNTLTFNVTASVAIITGIGSLIDLTGLSATHGFKIQGDVAGDLAGLSISSAGDVNGDGFADVLVGAIGNDSGGNYAGAAYVIFGKGGGFGTLLDLTDISPVNGFKIQGDVSDDQAGYSVSSAGDVNGDGFADVLVGARRNDSGGTDAGAVYVIFGKASGFGTLVDLTNLAVEDGFKIQGDVADDRVGYSVSSAGDVNGDGFADIIVGASGNDSGGDLAGAAYVIFGKANGFDALIDLTDLNAADGFKIQGDAMLDRAGRRVASAGDINGDGFADILVGTYMGSSRGAAYVIFGKASEFGALIDLTGLAAENGFKIQGDAAGDIAGFSVSSAGDVNGDGFADILVGAMGNDSGGADAGAAYVIFGKATGFGTLIDLSNLAVKDGYKIQGDAANDRAGISVSSAGDFNGDGFADILVGSTGNRTGGINSGAVFVVFGKSNGFGSPVDLTGLAAADGFKIQGENGFDYAGCSVSSAGDINGDGFADLILGARSNNSGGGSAGAAYVIFGRANANTAPTATNLNAAESYLENTPLNLTDIVATDTDSLNVTATLTLSNTAAGSLSTATSGAVTSTFVGGVWTASGAIANVNALLAGVIFNPATGFIGSFSLATSVSDGSLSVVGSKAFTGIAGPTTVGDTTYISTDYVQPANSIATVITPRVHADTTPLNITGNANVQTIIGNYGTNTLTGGGGADTLIGLRGNDTYIVSTGETVVVENPGEGSDTVRTSVSYILPVGAEVEILSAFSPTGTAPLYFTGNPFDQRIVGNAGDNIINGLGGNDTMIGLGGNDTFLVRGPGDIVIENNFEGFDTVYTTVSYNLGSNEVEVLSTVTHTDTTPINLIGNFVSQYVVGNYGDNLLNGGSGVDTLIGLFGNDLYAVGDSRIVVVEADGQGSDTVVTSVNYALGVDVSVEVLSAQIRSSTVGLVLTGNGFGQTIAATEGADTINGGAGNDVLIGGGGADRFDFTTLLGSTNVDAITDFGSTDRIGLSSAIFGGVGATLDAGEFVIGSAALDADDRIVYNQATGQLFYDADGNGAGLATLFAVVTPGTILSSASFTVIAP